MIELNMHIPSVPVHSCMILRVRLRSVKSDPKWKTGGVVPWTSSDYITVSAHYCECPAAFVPPPGHQQGRSSRSGRSGFGRTTFSPDHDHHVKQCQKCPECRILHPNFENITGGDPPGRTTANGGAMRLIKGVQVEGAKYALWVGFH